MPSIPRLIEMAMVPIVARETVNQFNGTITPNAQRFIEHGVVPPLARELAAQAALAQGSRSSARLIELGMAPDLAREVVN